MRKRQVVTFLVFSAAILSGLLVAFAQQDAAQSQTKIEPAQAAPLPGGAVSLPDPATPFTPNTPVAAPAVSAATTPESQAPASSAEAPVTQSQEVISKVKEPSKEVSAEAEEGIKINKEKISLDLKGIDVVELFRILSLKMGVTIVPTKSVSGRINIFLNNLTFDDALDVILISQDLACDIKGNIINIMTSAEYEKLYGKKYNEKRVFKSFKLSYAKPVSIFNALGQLKSDIGKVIADEATGTILLIDIPEKLDLMEATIKDLDRSPETEVFDIKYAKTTDMKTHLSTAITTGPGEIFVDERSSKVVVTDLPEKMKKIKRMVKAFDEESRQVFIEAEIVQITLKDEFQRGVSWEKILSNHNVDIKGSFPVANSFTPSPLLTADYFQAAVGILSSEKYSATLSLLQTFGNTKILSRPRIAVLNNQEAKILVGSREAYVTQTQSQAETTTVTAENIQFIDVGVKLNVVPTINKDGYITMKIKPEVSSVRETLTTALKSVIPIVDTAESESVVKVKDGAMVMIAGLMKDDIRKDSSGIPILSRIPFLGAAFGSRGQLKKRTEIVVFITPHIISGDITASGKIVENWFPPDTIPEDMGESVISKRVEEIKVKKQPQEEAVLLEEEQLKAQESPAPAAKAKESSEIQSKMKGIKEY